MVQLVRAVHHVPEPIILRCARESREGHPDCLNRGRNCQPLAFDSLSLMAILFHSPQDATRQPSAISEIPHLLVILFQGILIQSNSLIPPKTLLLQPSPTVAPSASPQLRGAPECPRSRGRGAGGQGGGQSAAPAGELLAARSGLQGRPATSCWLLGGHRPV